MASEIENDGKRKEGKNVGGQGLSDTQSGVPRWPGAAALLSIGASYLALSDYVTVVPRFWLPGLMVVLVTILLIAHARGHYRLARAISFALLGVVTISLVLREFFLVTTLSGRGTSAFSVLVDAVLIWVSTVVTFAVWYWEIDGGGPDERARETHASEDFLFPDPAAAPMPARAKGANGSRFSAEKAVNPTTMNRARTASLMSTMIVFAVADSRTPRMSSKPHNVTSTIAGRLKNPPSPGAALMAPGMRKPNRSKSSSLRYCPHPTDTAAAETPYSRSKHAATPNATISPIVA